MIDGNEKSAIIRMFHVYRSYGHKQALADITLDVSKNELVFISGPSGAGKTTLLKLLYLGETATDGQILVDGINLARIPHKRIPFLRRKFGIIFQDYKLIPAKTIFDNVALVLEAAGAKPAYIHRKVKSILRLVDMEGKSNAYPPTLSGGEQQRAAFARAVVGDPAIVVADEPTGSLDDESAAIIMELLRNIHIRGATVIVATHDKDLIGKMGGRVVFLKEGRIAAISHSDKQVDSAIP